MKIKAVRLKYALQGLRADDFVRVRTCGWVVRCVGVGSLIEVIKDRDLHEDYSGVYSGADLTPVSFDPPVINLNKTSFSRSS